MKFIYALIGLIVLLTGPTQAFELIEEESVRHFTVSGSWYDPDNPGWGIVVDQGVEGTFVAIFTYNFFTEDAGQAWYVGFNGPEEYSFYAPPYTESFVVNRPTGQFPAANYLQATPSGSFTFTQFNDDEYDTMLVEWSFSNEPPCVTPRVSPSPPFCKGSAVFYRFVTPLPSSYVPGIEF